MNTLAFFQNIGPFELVALALLGLLIFGKRLPEVGKSLGQSIVRFKEGLRGVEDEIEEASNRADVRPTAPPPAASQIESSSPAASIDEPAGKAASASEPAAKELVGSASGDDRRG